MYGIQLGEKLLHYIIIEVLKKWYIGLEVHSKEEILHLCPIDFIGLQDLADASVVLIYHPSKPHFFSLGFLYLFVFKLLFSVSFISTLAKVGVKTVFVHHAFKAIADVNLFPGLKERFLLLLPNS